ncbi:MAG: hypothetical protein ACK42C_00060 [Aquificaceae bacterium]
MQEVKGIAVVEMENLRVPLQKMQRLMEERKDLIVEIGSKTKGGKTTYEISRPLALELWKMLVEEVVSSGGKIEEDMKVEYASKDMVVVSMSVRIKVGEGEVVFTEVGEAYGEESGKDFTMARTAFTRAMKRMLERIAGEDFINQIIKKLYPAGFSEKPSPAQDKPATDKQKAYIRKLMAEKKLSEEELGVEIDKLTNESASKLIDQLRR